VVAWGAGVGTNAYVDCNQTTVPNGLTNVAQISGGAVNSLALVGAAPPVKGAFLSGATLGTNGFRVSLPARSGHVYRLEYKTALTNSNWTALPLVAGRAGTLELSDQTAAGEARYYRVRRW